MATSTAKPLTLTQAAYFMRKFILISGIMLIVLMVGRFTLSAVIGYWKATHPEPPPPPTVGFGPLPKVQFPANVGTPNSIRMEIPTERLAATTDRAKVFFIPAKRASLLALDKAKQQASVLGFLFDPDPLTTEIYRWRRTTPMTANLDYNIITGTFTMKLDWQSDPAFFQENRLPDENGAIDDARQMLSSAGLLSKDIATSSAKVSYLKASGSTYASTVSLSESDFLQVDIFRDNIDTTYPVVTEIPDKGTIRAIVTGKTDRSLQFASVEYNYVPIEYSSYYTYPVIDPQAAYKLLQQGKGFTAAMPQTGTDVVIRSISLGYFDTSQDKTYLQPIYILSGDGGYVGYVSAIPTACLQDNISEFKTGCK